MSHFSERYKRQIQIPEINSRGQEKLQSAKVLVVGAGGLGCPVLLYLSSCGIGTIGVADGDVVQESNLHRQILFRERDIESLKVEVAKSLMLQRNQNTIIETYPYYLNRDNVFGIIEKYDLIIDGSDNFKTRYLVNDACYFSQKALVFGSILQFSGQVTCFNLKLDNGTRSANYRDLYPEPPHPKDQLNCNEAGVPGTLPGIVGTIMANEALKYFVQPSSCLFQKLLLIDGLGNSYQTISYQKNSSNPISGDNPTQLGLIDYDVYCQQKDVPTLTWEEYDEKQLSDRIRLIDVRTEQERNVSDRGGEHIPLEELEKEINVQKDDSVAFYCESGIRSISAVQRMKAKFPNVLFYSIEGGIQAIEQEL